MRTRILQTALLITALILGLTTDVYNGQTVLAFALIGATILIERRRLRTGAVHA